ncbi:MAG: hypothetical protein AAF609_24610 [Cyanobacteria bacterium P01_C01_bin.120]
MNEIRQQLELLNEVIKRSLSLEEVKTSINLILFIRRSLNQAGLYPDWQESEILVEAYLRVRGQINAGKAIHNLPAYLTRTSQLIVLEKYRHRQRHVKIAQKLSGSKGDDLAIEASYTEGVNQTTINLLWRSFEALSERDQRVITLRIVKGYSWKEIAYILVELGIEPKYTPALIMKLRKQGERALEKLRKAMLSVNN